MARTTAQLVRDGVEVEGVTLPREADQVIIALAEEKAPTSSWSAPWLRRLRQGLLGSVSERVIGNAGCAVLVVKV